MRTQQVIACESGVANTIDPLAGSYFVESLTDKMEREAENYFRKIDEIGGVVRGIETGWFQKEIARSAARYQKETETKERIIVGVNEYRLENEKIDIPIQRIDPEVEAEQRARLEEVKRKRDAVAVETALKNLRSCADSKNNIFPEILNCVRAYATLGEIIDVMKAVFGEWRAPIVY